MLDDRQRVVRQGDSATELLAAHAVAPDRRSGTLPAALESWVRRGRTEEPMVIPSARGQLRLRLVQAPSPPGGWLIALHERRMHPPSITSLIDAFGLSRRQAEVLRLLCSGRDTDGVARELQITRATVRKHLEQVYARLGVGSKAAAVALALGEPGMAHR